MDGSLSRDGVAGEALQERRFTPRPGKGGGDRKDGKTYNLTLPDVMSSRSIKQTVEGYITGGFYVRSIYLYISGTVSTITTRCEETERSNVSMPAQV